MSVDILLLALKAVAILAGCYLAARVISAVRNALGARGDGASDLTLAQAIVGGEEAAYAEFDAISLSQRDPYYDPSSPVFLLNDLDK